MILNILIILYEVFETTFNVLIEQQFLNKCVLAYSRCLRWGNDFVIIHTYVKSWGKPEKLYLQYYLLEK